MKFVRLATAALFAMLGSALVASPLDAPRLSRRVNAVAFDRAGDGFHVGPGSRAELRIPDGTLARLGAETVLRFRRGTRELKLERGTLLLEVPGFCGGARVRAGALTAVCGAGTFLLEHLPSQSLKIVVLEGDARVAASGFLGDSLVIAPGKMLITATDVKIIPDPVDVDLGTLVKTSALLNEAPLASRPRIEREIARQAGALRGQRLIPTNLAIVGSGTSVVIPAAPGAAVAGPQSVAKARERAGGNEDRPLSPAEMTVDQRSASLPIEQIPLPDP
ncbi:MAG: FecR family protein [Chthoniobacteraceae bacterium]